MKICSLLNETLRPSPCFVLTEWNQLPQAAKEFLFGLENDAEVYGLFLPAGNIRAPKLAYKETAMLYLHLQHTHLLPHYFTAAPGHQKNETIARLILDGIIEVQWKEKFVSGTAAVTAVFGNYLFEEDKLPSHLSILSMEALYNVWAQPLQDTEAVAAKLYAHHTMIWDAETKNSFLQKHSIRQFLFPGIDIGINEWPGHGWQFIAAAEKKGWLSWVRPSSEEEEFLQTYKLYISTTIDNMPALMQKTMPLISVSKAVSFKTGSTLHGLLRPDKLVLYFINKPDLMDAFEMLKKELADFPAQGVPFTAQLDDKGLFSYGTDPPQEYTFGKKENESWRTVITDKLAVCIVQTKQDNTDWQQSLAFIKASLLTDGVSPDTWEQTGSIN